MVYAFFIVLRIIDRPVRDLLISPDIILRRLSLKGLLPPLHSVGFRFYHTYSRFNRMIQYVNDNVNVTLFK